MRPLRTAVMTAALRRTTHRLVFGGGRSSLIAEIPSGVASGLLLTGHHQDLGGPERLLARGDLSYAGLIPSRGVALECGPIGGGNDPLGWQRAGGGTAGDAL